jgi:hypothetical protein
MWESRGTFTLESFQFSQLVSHLERKLPSKYGAKHMDAKVESVTQLIGLEFN